MKLHIANLYDAERHTAVAGEAIALGAVIKIVNDGGSRKALQVADADAAALVPGNYGVAYKVPTDPLSVTSSTAPAAFGIRTLSIVSGDLIVQCERDTILEYDVSLLHDSLNPSAGGALPAATTALGIKGGKFCTAATAGAITSPVVGRVFDIIGSKVRIKLV